jgi:thiosulfate reductase/polysulfide reductase chain A
LSPKTKYSSEKIIPTFCHGCGSYRGPCGLLCHVQDGRFVRVEGDPAACNNGMLGSTSLCPKAFSAPQYVYAADRLQYPLKRAGAKGEGRFQRITWDEALDTIASKLQETKQKYGPEAFGVLSPEYWPVLGILGRRFLNVYGSPNYMHSAICATPRMASARASVGFFSMGPGDWGKTKLFVNWGANPENSGVNKGTPRTILDALARGMRYVDIRPMRDPLGAKADTWLPIRPGTDCALALAILNVLISEQLYDKAFVADWCHGFGKLAEHVPPFTPEWAAPVTGLPADQIRDTARLIGTTHPTFIMMGNGVGDQTSDGTSTVWAISLIVAITGNLGVPGGQNPPGPGSALFPPISRLAELAPPDLADKLVAPEGPVWYQKVGWTENGPTSAYYKGLMSILTGEPYALRALGAGYTNPLSATRNPQRVAEALRKLDFMFVMDVSHGPHVDFADIVLPACTSYEQDLYFGTKMTPEGTLICGYNQVVEPLGESRSDWTFYLDLAVRMGYGEHFWQGDPQAMMDEMLAPYDLTAQQLRQNPEGMLQKRPAPPGPATEAPGQEAPAPRDQQAQRWTGLFKDLPYGKVQCYNEYLGGKPTNDGTGTLPYLPVYQGPPEGLAQTPEFAREFPLILSDVHAHRLSHHSWLHNSAYLRELQPYPWLKVNPATAQKYGIADGDWVKVESPHGWCRLKAQYFDAISNEVVMAKRGWWQACDELGLPGYGFGDGGSEVNNLYSSDPALFDKFFSQMPKQTLVKISRWEED